MRRTKSRSVQISDGRFSCASTFRRRVIDRVELGRINPHEATAVTHRGDGGGGVGAFVANQDGGFATADDFNERGIAFHGFRNFTIAAGENGFGGDVARLAAGVGGDHAHLLHRADVLHDGVEREHVDFVDLGLLLSQAWLRWRSRREDLVVIVTGLGELASFVRHGRRSL